MDAAAMTAGGAIGGFLGGGVFSPITASIGATIGKQLSDGAQYLFKIRKHQSNVNGSSTHSSCKGRYALMFGFNSEKVYKDELRALNDNTDIEFD